MTTMTDVNYNNYSPFKFYHILKSMCISPIVVGHIIHNKLGNYEQCEGVF